MRRFVLAAIATFGFVGLVMGEELTVVITKADASKNTITYTKGGFGKKKDDTQKPEPVTANVAKGAKIAEGVIDPDAKGKGGKGGFGGAFKAGDDLKDGLNNEVFKNLTKDDSKGVFARITTADADDAAKGVKKGDVTQILTVNFKGKGKGGN
jgi:hypothetical protein